MALCVWPSFQTLLGRLQGFLVRTNHLGIVPVDMLSSLPEERRGERERDLEAKDPQLKLHGDFANVPMKATAVKNGSDCGRDVRYGS